MDMYGGVGGVSEDVEGKLIKKLYKSHPEYFNVAFKDIKKMKKVGEGMFGAVYRARYEDEEVAVKRIFLPTKTAFKYLCREIENLKIVNHPNIIKFIGATHDNFKAIYVLMEFVEGGHLESKRIKKLRSANQYGTIFKIILNLARAMAYLESIHMVHRDLKMAHKDYSVIKLCDFGLAKLIKAPETAQFERERKMTCVGTKKYMAPEEICDGESSKFDVYSFGVVVAEMLGFPYRTKKFDEKLFEKKRDRRAPIELVCLCQMCTKASPSERPSFKSVLVGLESLTQIFTAPALSASTSVPTTLSATWSGSSENDSIISPSHSLDDLSASAPLPHPSQSMIIKSKLSIEPAERPPASPNRNSAGRAQLKRSISSGNVVKAEDVSVPQINDASAPRGRRRGQVVCSRPPDLNLVE